MHKLFILLMFAIVQFAAAQNTQKPCSAPEARQFDFWIGEWELTWPGGQGGTPEGQTGHGVNHVVQYLGECVIFENFSFADSSFIGKSWSVYNSQSEKWQQTWVDNSGAYLLFTGAFADGKMELRTAPFQRNGVTYISRMVFRNIAAKAFDWDWQRSADNGETWQDMWNIHYQRKTASAEN